MSSKEAYIHREHAVTGSDGRRQRVDRGPFRYGARDCRGDCGMKKVPRDVCVARRT